MNRTVVFRIKVDRKNGSFALASNFIHKMEKEESEISWKEVGGISTKILDSAVQIEKDGNMNRISEWTEKNEKSFQLIRHPENLHIDIQKIYCLKVREEDLDDVTELQYFILLKKYFSSIPMILNLSGSESFYYKVSHYLYSVVKFDKHMYNSIFFCENTNIKRLQLTNIGALKDFFPLQIIDDRNLKLLSETMDMYLYEDDFRRLFTKQNKEIISKVPLELRGSLDIWRTSAEFVEKEDIKEIYEDIRALNVLSFLLLSYSLKYIKRGIENKNWHGYIRQINEYSVGVYQLVENVVQHSDVGKGVLSIRIHNRSTYLKHKYGGNIQKNIPYLEIAVVDYSAENSSGNIVDTFRSQMDNERDKELFSDVRPKDFFQDRYADKSERGRKIQEIFDEYYGREENVGKHFGLQIFKSIVQKNAGIFACYSHRSHEKELGEEYNMAKADVKQFIWQLPGTGYMILLPLKASVEEIKRADTDVETFLDIGERAKEYIQNFKYDSKELELNGISVETRIQKQEMIQSLAKQFNEDINLCGKQRRIYYINCLGMKDEFGEYICKALLRTELRKKLPDYVFYNCTENFVELFRNSIKIHFERNIISELSDNDYTIALYTTGRVQETIICPKNYEKTYLLNRMSSFARGNREDLNWLRIANVNTHAYVSHNRIEQIPFDILFPVDFDEGKMTIFEKYTLEVLESNIQEKLFGCKIERTHMRLGSTIHIDSFYEAELLFSNKMFISRFAFLLVKQIHKDIEGLDKYKKITLYSYALYSELFIFEVMNILKIMHKDWDVDYIILERAAEHRDYSHIDRIRYSRKFESDEERNKYFQDRMLITVVPIESTLKTHTKLVELFEKANSSFSRKNILKNYAIILVGSKIANNYWNLEQTSKIISGKDDKFTVQYMLEVKVDYQEALGCEMCFPKEPLNERPLIEVNAASTIPNQSFGLYNNKTEIQKMDYQSLKEIEEELYVLKKYMIYAHTERGENHFLFYFLTDEFFVSQKSKIVNWLKKLDIQVDPQEYHVLFCPAHFSNAGFLEYINKYIFHDAAVIIRADVDKEYRSNLLTKYSNLRILLHYLEQDNTEKKVVRVYYVDDSIITGRTYFRSKSIISSTLGIYEEKYENVDVKLFDKIFVLIDRNSRQSRMQYVQSPLLIDAEFFAYMTINISSLRHHGDSCVLCQLEVEADRIYRTSATRPMAEYWKKAREKFRGASLEDRQLEMAEEANIEERKEKAFRRLFCTHTVTIMISEKYHGNNLEKAIQLILQLLLVDYKGRKEKESREIALEYFFSYLKVISRPFLVFNKAVKEAIYDILLVLSDILLDCGQNKMDTILKRADKKEYLEKFKEEFAQLQDEVINQLAPEKESMDFLLLLIKQLTELKSNYYIRREVIYKVRNYIADFSKEMQNQFYKRYLRSIKKLLEINSDTSKSAWFNRELTDIITEKGWENVPFSQNVFSRLFIENTRSYHNGIVRLCDEQKIESEWILKCAEQKEKEDIAKRLIEIINNVKYRDFKDTLVIDGLLRGKDNIVMSEDDFYSIIANIQLLKEFPRSEKKDNSEAILETCANIAIFLHYILKAFEVQMMIEIPMECDLWRQERVQQYNDLVRKYKGYLEDKENQAFERALLKETVHSDYLLLANGKNNEDIGSYVSPAIVDCLREYRQEERTLGYWVNENERYLIWEFGQKSKHQILLYAKWAGQGEVIPKYLKNLRYAMSNYYELNTQLFDDGTRSHIHELLLTGKDSLVYKQKKVYSHTESAIQAQQLDNLLNRMGDKSLYVSYTLTLLSDMTVSNIYRQSLKKEYYQNTAIGDYEIKADDLFSDYKKIERFYAIQPNSTTHIQVTVHFELEKGMQNPSELQVINGEDKLLRSCVMNGAKVLLLLIHALIMNVAKDDRGRGILREKSDLQQEKSGIEERKVYLMKTREGYLRIMNEYRGTGPRPEDINQELKYPPRNESKGISLWSVSRYLYCIQNRRMKKWLEEEERRLQDDFDMRRIEGVKQKMKQYLEEDYIGVRCGTMQINNGENKSITYFYVDLPVFAEIYSKIYNEREEV